MSVPFEVLILGSGSAIPNKNKNHTSQVVVYNNKHFLFDCGEGTQIQLKKFGVSLQKIDHIFISHLHGDHYLGLAGLVSSLTLLGREKKLFIYGPPRIKDVINLHFQIANSRSAFDIEYVETQDKSLEILYDVGNVTISSFPVKHKIPTTGFLVTAGSRKRKLVASSLKKYDVPKHLRAGISEGRDYKTEAGTVIKNEDLTTDPLPVRRYAFCADTRYLPELTEYLEGVNLMYHETSFLKEDKKRAKIHFHTTAEQAAELAKTCKVEKLLIGHFSNKYQDDQAFITESRSVFKETYIAKEGERYEV
jgi:ribonuclease Z